MTDGENCVVTDHLSDSEDSVSNVRPKLHVLMWLPSILCYHLDATLLRTGAHGLHKCTVHP